METQHATKNHYKLLDIVNDTAIRLGKEEPTTEYFKKIALMVNVGGNSRLVLVRDKHNPDIWWIELVGGGKLPRPEQFRKYIIVCKILGCKYLAAENDETRFNGWYEKLEFDNVGRNIYSLKLED